jgi:ferrous iron transport protein A
MSNSLRDLAAGDTGRVVGFAEGSKAYRRKLLAMGLTPGIEFSITRYAPMGDPVEIRVRGFSLSLRKAEAQALQVERTSA